MLDFDVQVLTPFGAKILAAALVRAHKRPVDLGGSTPEMLLTLVFALRLFIFACLALALLHLGLYLTLTSLLQQSLLMLLLPQPVEELVRLGENLRDQRVLVEVLYVEYLTGNFVVLRRNLIDF